MKLAIIAAAALVVAAPAAAQSRVSTTIDFGTVPLGSFTSAVFGAYRIVNQPGYGSGTSVFLGANGAHVLGDTVADMNGAGYVLSRLDGGLFDLDSVTFGKTADNTGSRVTLATYSGKDRAVTVTADGQVVAPAIRSLTTMFIDANAFASAGGVGISSLTVSALPATPAVPEPVTWALMVVGFGAVGASMRYGRRATAVRFA